MSKLCDTCQRNQVCRRPMDGIDSCRLYISGKESNYDKLFGTPEKAARVAYYLHKCSLIMPIEHDNCAAKPICASGAKNYNELLEWLKADSE